MLHKLIDLAFFPVLDLADEYGKARENRALADRDITDAFAKHGANSEEWKIAREEVAYWCEKLAAVNTTVNYVHRLTGLRLETMLQFRRIVRKRGLNPKDVYNHPVWRKKYRECERLLSYLIDAQN